jgi:hypothetical protein
MNPDDIEACLPGCLSDEAAAELHDLLNGLALAVENRYFAQIRRYHSENHPDRFDPDRPWINRPTVAD